MGRSGKNTREVIEWCSSDYTLLRLSGVTLILSKIQYFLCQFVRHSNAQDLDMITQVYITIYFVVINFCTEKLLTSKTWEWFKLLLDFSFLEVLFSSTELWECFKSQTQCKYSTKLKTIVKIIQAKNKNKCHEF